MEAPNATWRPEEAPFGALDAPQARADVQAWRALIPATKHYAYLDHAAVGPTPLPTSYAILETLRLQGQCGSLEHPALHRKAEDARNAFASFCGAEADNIAFAANTSSAISTVARGLDWRPGDEVVVPDIDFPSVILPWKTLEARGVGLRVVPCANGVVPMEDLLAACTSRTRVLAASWVQFTSGYRIDLVRMGEACRARGIVFVVDIMQGIGVLPIDLAALPIDAAAAHSYKWMLATQGVGWLYLSDALSESLAVSSAGSRTVTARASFCNHAFDLRGGAPRHESGILDFHAIAGAMASLELLAGVGRERIAERALGLAQRLRTGLLREGCEILGDPRDPDRQSAIVAFRHPRADAEPLREALLGCSIVTSVREGCVRVSPHFYNTEAEIDRLLNLIR